MQLLLAFGIIAVSGLGAFWFLNRQSAARDARNAQREAEERARQAAQYGYSADDPPLWEPSDPDPLIRKILDEGDADNSNHLDRRFRDAFRAKLAEGPSVGIAQAFIHAMAVACWRRNSRREVYDRLYSNRLISEAEKNQLSADAARLPDGHGTYAPCNPTTSTADMGRGARR
jgi:hypothetical protein